MPDHWLARSARGPTTEDLHGTVTSGLISVTVRDDATLENLTPADNAARIVKE